MYKKIFVLFLLACIHITNIKSEEFRNYFGQISFITELEDPFIAKIISKVTYGEKTYPIYKIIYNEKKK